MLFPPVFARGHLSFMLDGHTIEFVQQGISVFGVTGLSWAPLDSKKHFGCSTIVTIRITDAAKPFAISTSAFLTREQTLYSEQMGLRFNLSDEQKKLLGDHIKKNGYYPTEYVRKYPRIPSADTIQTFPLRVVGTLPANLREAESIPVVFDVANLSPNGILLKTENQMALDIAPGQKLNLSLDPRGWFPVAVQIQGTVCRINDDLNLGNGNRIRYLGIKFTKVDEANRQAFLDLLKDILIRLKIDQESA